MRIIQGDSEQTCKYYIEYRGYSTEQFEVGEPTVHEASLLQQLLKLMATNLNANMASAYKILPHSDKYP